jgi:hypothetical protein
MQEGDMLFVGAPRGAKERFKVGGRLAGFAKTGGFRS